MTKALLNETRRSVSVTEANPDPTELHKFIRVAVQYIVTFPSEKRLASYRRMLYSVNGQGTFRYRTIRDEQSAYGLIIWRMR